MDGPTQTGGLRGIDISAWQPRVDFAQVASAGYRFAWIKTSEGLTYLSPTLGAQWEGAGKAGLLRGAYHFFHPLLDPIAQAERFARIVQSLGLGELPPALDFEAFKGTKGAKPDQLVAAALACLDELERLVGVVPLLYTGPSFWKYHLAPSSRALELTRWPLWEASYGAAPRPMPWPETAWGTRYTIWQQSGSGRVPGVAGNCDLNVFPGTIGQLRSLLGGNEKEATS